MTNNWGMRAGLHHQMEFPSEVAATPLRPDIVLWSRSTKQLAKVGLTVQWENRMDEAYVRKRSKYQQFVEEC